MWPPVLKLIVKVSFNSTSVAIDKVNEAALFNIFRIPTRVTTSVGEVKSESVITVPDMV